MALIEAVLDLGAPLRIADGFRSPWGRHLIVDPTGKGNHTSINAAIAEATAGSPATSGRWLIEVRQAVYTEVVDVPSFVTLQLPLGPLTTINGGTGTTPSVTLRGRAALVGGNIIGQQLAVRIVGDIVGGVPTIVGSVISASRDINDVVTCIELTGTSFSGAFANVFGCGTIYARNGHAGASAKAVVYRLMAGGPALEAYFNHHKLSGGIPGTADMRLAWNQSNDQYAQLNVTGDLAVYNGVDFFDLYSENAAAQHGGRIMVPHTGWVSEYGTNYNVPLRKTYDVGTHPLSNRYRHNPLSVDTDTLTVRGSTYGTDPRLPSAFWYSISEWVSGTSTLAQPINTARTYPFRVKYDTPINGTRMEVTAASASAVARVSLYLDDGYGNPGAKAFDLGTASGAATGNVDVLSGGVYATFTLLAGVIYHVYVGIEDAAATWRSVTGSVGWTPETGTGVTLGQTVTHTSGSTPSPFVSTGAYHGGAPRVQFRTA